MSPYRRRPDSVRDIVNLGRPRLIACSRCVAPAVCADDRRCATETLKVPTPSPGPSKVEVEKENNARADNPHSAN